MLGLLYVDNLATPGSFSGGGPAVPGRVRAASPPAGIRAARSAERAAARGDDALQLRAVLRAVGGGRHRRAAGRHPAGRRPAAAHRALQRHPGLHGAGRVDGAGRDRRAPERLLHRNGRRHLRARRHARQVHRRRHHGAVGRADRAIRTTPSARSAAAVGMQHAVAEINAALGGAGPADHQRRHRHQLRRGVRRQHRQPPPPGVHRHRRRGERGLAALLRGGAGRNPAHRVVPPAAGQEEARRGAGRGDRDQGARRQGDGLPAATG